MTVHLSTPIKIIRGGRVYVHCEVKLWVGVGIGMGYVVT